MIKLATVTSLALLLTAGYALATPMTSGRPSAVLTTSQCQEVWSTAATNGDTLSEKNALPYIVNFKLSDRDHNGQISKSEFERACKKGLVQYAGH